MTGLVLTLHPASDGDALVLSWGAAQARHHAVIDLGRSRDYLRLRPWLVQTGQIDLLVLSHIDADHIEGAMPMVVEPAAPFAPADVWFNAHRHLRIARDRRDEHETLSVAQGEKLSDGIARFGWRWNGAFAGGPVSTNSAAAAEPMDLHGLRITLLSPDDAALSALEKDWDKALKAAALRRGDKDEAKTDLPDLETLAPLDVEALAGRKFQPDTATPNGSSIAFIAEHGGKRVLLAADAHPTVLVARLRALGYSPQHRLALDLFKLPHHGSKANLSPDLLALLDCTRFAISTDGSKHGFPSPETIARILKADPQRKKTFYCNFRNEIALEWAAGSLPARWNFEMVAPAEGQEGLSIAV